MKIRLAIDPARARLWQRDLAADLRRRGHLVSVAVRAVGPPQPRAIGWLLTLERLAYGRRPEAPGAEWQDAAALAADTGDGTPDLEIDLTGDRPAMDGRRTLRPVYSGALVEDAALSALLDGKIPEIGVADSDAPDAPAMTRPAIEDPLNLTRALDNLGTRMASLLVRAVGLAERGEVVSGQMRPTLRDITSWTGGGTFGALGRKAQLMVNRMLAKPPHWYVGWRQPAGDGVRETLRTPSGGWKVLPDDGQRFYADPFVICVEGRTWLFVEEFSYATGKGILSTVEMGPQGPIGTPRPVMDLPYHLSYPFVFEHDGAIWMIPETAAARRIELWRADAFPYSWSRAAVLVEDVLAGDCTVLQQDGRWWMFGTIGGEGQSSWDALCIWSAPALMGPWTAHRSNPVLLDAQCARPAGAFFQRGDALWRPAQDCTTGYGAGLALCRVTRLDDEAFEQSVETVLRPNADWPGLGFHTLNEAAGIEVVDGCRRRG